MRQYLEQEIFLLKDNLTALNEERLAAQREADKIPKLDRDISNIRGQLIALQKTLSRFNEDTARAEQLKKQNAFKVTTEKDIPPEAEADPDKLKPVDQPEKSNEPDGKKVTEKQDAEADFDERMPRGAPPVLTNKNHKTSKA